MKYPIGNFSKNKKCRSAVLYIPNDVGDLAVQNEADGVQGFDVHVHAVPHAMQGMAGKAMFVDKLVFRDALVQQV